MELMTGRPLWDAIQAEAKRAPRRAMHCAIGYLGPTAAAILPLREGDVLVCDASDWTVKKGATSPIALADFLKLGVDLYSCEALHAKVVAAGGRAWVGSMNASMSSRDVLVEAAVMFTDKSTVASAKAFVLSQAHIPVSAEDVTRLASMAPQRPGFPHLHPPRADAGVPPDLSDVFIVRPDFGEWNATAWRLYDGDVGTARSERKRELGHHAALSALEWSGRTGLRRGSWVIEIAGGHALAPACVVHMAESRGTRVVWLARPSGDVSRVSIREVDDVLHRAGRRVSSAPERRLKGAVVSDLLALFQPA